MRNYNYLILLLTLLTFPEVAQSASRSWYQKANVGGEARHRCTAFSIGNKGYYGGGHINSGVTVTYKDYWEYDPSTNSWTQIADFGGGFRYHSSAFTIGHEAYVGCGEDNAHNYTNDFWKYIPEVNTWFPVADLPGIERRGGTAVTIDGKGYFGTGQSDAGYHTDFYRYDPETDEWTELADFPGEPRSAAVSFAIDGKAYVGTGHKVGEALSDFYEYDPATDVWTPKTSVGGPIRQDAMAFTIDGKGYIGTGNDNIGNDFRDIWEYDVDADTWTQIDDFPGQKRRYAVTFVIGSTAYLVGGTDGTNFKDLWAFAPTLSIEEELMNTEIISLYPNPSSSIIRINTQVDPTILSKLSFSIMDVSGRVIVNDRPLTNTITLDKSDFGTGIFFLNVNYENAVYRSHKFIFN